MKPNFADFLKKFPQVELPVSLTNESHFVFSRENDVLPTVLVEEFIIPYDEEVDEFTEYIPCLQLPDQNDFYGIVYWKASLLVYEYILITYDKTGKFITKQVIAGLKTNLDSVLQRLAVIDEELIITIAEGAQLDADRSDYDPGSTKAYHMEILSSGDIIYAVG